MPRPGDPQSFNRYSFVSNNPLSRVDPTGHCDGTPGGANCNPYDYAGEDGVAESLKNYAQTIIQPQVLLGALRPVEALARIADIGMEYARNQIPIFMWAMTNVMLGVDPHRVDVVLTPLFSILKWQQSNPYFVGQDFLNYLGSGPQLLLHEHLF